ncbi:MAG TPA: glycosyltransferase family 39 protein [Anaerolineae bacterium]|nr:glycosyltransferase family 39 protein [Anaerolineae bacterium]
MAVSSLPDNRRLETTPTQTTPTQTTPTQTTPAQATSTVITVEMMLYAGVFGLALFLRLFRLGLTPLSESEAAQALAALRGGVLPAGGSPMLYSINSFLAAVFSTTDTLVRLTPALAGSLIVLAPALFRDLLGRVGALGAALILALSPVALVASRSLDGEVVVVGCVLALIVLARRYMQARAERDVLGAAIALGIGLAAGPGIYTALLAMAASLVALRFALGGEWGGELWSAWNAIAHSPNRLKIAAALVGAFVVAATGGLTNLAGLSAAGDVLTAWLNTFGASTGSTAFDIVQVLLVYETLALLVGFAGLLKVLTQRRQVSPPVASDGQEPAEIEDEKNAPDSLLGAWLGFVAIIALAIIMLQTGRRPIDLLLPVTLLALLAGLAVESWAEQVRARAALLIDGVIVAVGLVVVVYFTLTLAAFVRGQLQPGNVFGTILPPEMMLVVLFVLMFGAVGVLMAAMFNRRSVLRGAATVSLLVLTAASFAAGWGATQVRVGDAREIVWGPRVTTSSVRTLVDAAEQTALRSTGTLERLPLRLEVDDPVLAWYLRHAQLLEGETAVGVVTRYGEQLPTADGGYIGSRFNTQAAWDTLGLNLDTWLAWALFRDSAEEQPVVTQSVTLWEKRADND